MAPVALGPNKEHHLGSPQRDHRPSTRPKLPVGAAVGDRVVRTP